MRATLLTLASLFLFSACGTASPTGAAVDAAAEEAPEETAITCAELSEKACLDSLDCSLVLNAEAQGGYLCRQALPPCETGFSQAASSAEDCAAKTGCTFVPGQCYCAPDVVCICGGGPPPSCAAEEPSRATEGSGGAP